jgi:hypothetical protein
MQTSSPRFVDQKFDLMFLSQDATTNPSLILAAVNKAGYARLVDIAISYAKEKGGDIDTQVGNAADRLVGETLRGTWLGTDAMIDIHFPIARGVRKGNFGYRPWPCFYRGRRQALFR